MTVDEMLELMAGHTDYRPLVTTQSRPLPHKILGIDVDTECVLICAVNDDYRFWTHISFCTRYDDDLDDE